MIEQIVLIAFCAVSIGFMLYVIVSLQREIRREDRDRLERTCANPQQGQVSVFPLVKDATGEMTETTVYEPLAKKSAQNDRTPTRLSVRTFDESASGGSR